MGVSTGLTMEVAQQHRKPVCMTFYMRKWSEKL